MVLHDRDMGRHALKVEDRVEVHHDTDEALDTYLWIFRVVEGKDTYLRVVVEGKDIYLRIVVEEKDIYLWVFLVVEGKDAIHPDRDIHFHNYQNMNDQFFDPGEYA